MNYLLYCIQFIREDLEHVDGGADQASFHGSDDLISVTELWQMWIRSVGKFEQYCEFIISKFLMQNSANFFAGKCPVESV